MLSIRIAGPIVAALLPLVTLVVVCGSALAQMPNLETLRQAANQGDAMAQFMLGEMYENGEGVSPDTREAVNWYRKAAAQSHAIDQNNLSEGVSQDERATTALNRCVVQQSTAQAIARARFKLGWLYDTGEGVLQNARKAARWYRRTEDLATDQNKPGEGVSQDQREMARSNRCATSKPTAQVIANAQSNLRSLYRDVYKGLLLVEAYADFFQEDRPGFVSNVTGLPGPALHTLHTEITRYVPDTELEKVKAEATQLNIETQDDTIDDRVKYVKTHLANMCHTTPDTSVDMVVKMAGKQAVCTLVSFTQKKAGIPSFMVGP